MEIGVYTFAELQPDPLTGERISPAERMKNLLEEIRLADEVGLDVFGVGEHHREDFLVSAPAMVLAAASQLTKTIRLTSAVTVLSSDDPVRVFQDFATLDLLSEGRAEIMAGRGSFIESFPLFGFDLADYDELFAEKLDLLMKLVTSERITWRGKHRSPIDDLPVFPRPHQERIPIWIAVGGNPGSAIRAGSLGLPMAIAIIGGIAERFATFEQLHREAARRAGHDSPPPVSINSHGYIADTWRRAVDDSFPYVASMMNKIGRERGWPPLRRGDYEASTALEGANFVGTPEQIVEKILYQHEIFHHERFLLQFSVGPLPHPDVMRSIELLGTKVAPVVRAETAGSTASPSREAPT